MWTQREFGVSAPIASGTRVVKVGRTTGTTDGVISRTCVTIGTHFYTIDSRPIELQCQYSARPAPELPYYFHISGAYDEGAPVFTVTGGSEVRFEGILWGGTPDPYNAVSGYDVEYFISPHTGIEQDFYRLLCCNSMITYSFN